MNDMTPKPCTMPEEMFFGVCKHYGIRLTSKTKTEECPVRYIRADLVEKGEGEK